MQQSTDRRQFLTFRRVTPTLTKKLSIPREFNDLIVFTEQARDDCDVNRHGGFPTCVATGLSCRVAQLNRTSQTPGCFGVVAKVLTTLGALWEVMCACYCDGDFGGVTGKDWQFGFDFFFVKTEEFIGSLKEKGKNNIITDFDLKQKI